MKPGPATAGGTVPINITFNGGTQSYNMSPSSPHIDHGGTAQFNATNESCTIYFNPATTPFGTSIDLMNGHNNVNVPVGTGDYSVGYCITTYGGTCVPLPPASGLTATPSGTIKVGSGGTKAHGPK